VQFFEDAVREIEQTQGELPVPTPVPTPTPTLVPQAVGGIGLDTGGTNSTSGPGASATAAIAGMIATVVLGGAAFAYSRTRR
jgi:hypothetical protein